MKKLFQRKPKSPDGLSMGFTYDKEQILAIQKKQEAEQVRFKEQYGDDWEKHWWEFRHPKPDYDGVLKNLNIALFVGETSRTASSPEHSRAYHAALEKGTGSLSNFM